VQSTDRRLAVGRRIWAYQALLRPRPPTPISVISEISGSLWPLFIFYPSSVTEGTEEGFSDERKRPKRTTDFTDLTDYH
jgi:hypothetical protein